MRHSYLRYFLKIEIGIGSSIHMGCFITGNHIRIGKNSVINRNCYLDGREGIEIGDNVSISPWVYVLSDSHDVQSHTFKNKGGVVTIGNFAWLGVRAIIMPNVKINEGAVVGAGSVVTKHVDEYSIVGGVPARKIGERTRGLNYSCSYFPFFDTDIAPL